ncbi:MAG: carboxypeptidase-like regulatory domain-containing protein, partial [Bacteroidales bacterium]
MKKLLLILFVFISSQASVLAQDRSITGKVTSVEDGLGLPGVSIYIKGTTQGTVSDIDGNYKISGVQPETILVFSYVGYEAREVEVKNQSVINIEMNISAAELGEVLVTALGVKRQKREIGYSTEKIDADIVAQSNAPNILNAISGRSAGVQVMQGDGVEGGSTRIVIRGNNNILGNNQPLIVVDNVQMLNTPGLNDIGRGVDWGNPLSDINPLDIETYTVLKGGAASALYGSRGANGVILITTKRGKKQKGIGVSYSFTHKISQPYRYREVQDKYGHGGPVS